MPVTFSFFSGLNIFFLFWLQDLAPSCGLSDLSSSTRGTHTLCAGNEES